jgi:hypothetical protein
MLKLVIRFVIFSIGMGLFFTSLASNEGILGAKSFGLGGNSIFLKEVWSSSNNPSQLPKLKGFQAGINYGNRFTLSELATKSLAATYGKENQGFGLSFSQFGYSLYSENTLGLSYGMQLSDNFSVGIQLNYLSTQIGDDYGSKAGVSATIGLTALITEELSFAAVLINPNRLKLNDYQDERYPTLLKLGLAYTFSNKVNLMSEYVKDIDREGDLKIGVDYQFNKVFSFQTGYSTTPASFSFGFGINYTDFNIQLSSAYDQYLGFSPQISLIFNPRRMKDEN